MKNLIHLFILAKTVLCTVLYFLYSKRHVLYINYMLLEI